MDSISPNEVLRAREQILGASLELFARQGVAGTSLRQIAERVDLHNSTLLHYFGSKADLARRVFDAVTERHRELFEPLGASPVPDPEAGIEVLCRAARHMRSHPDEARILLRSFAGLEPGLEADDGEGGLAPLRELLVPWLAKARGTRRPRREQWSPEAWQLLGVIVTAALLPGHGKDGVGEERIRAGARALLQIRG